MTPWRSQLYASIYPCDIGCFRSYCALDSACCECPRPTSMRPSLPEDCEKRTLELDRYGHGEILCRPRFSQAARAGRGDVLAKTKCRAVYAWKMMREKTNMFIGECGRGVLKASSCVDTLSAMTSRAVVYRCPDACCPHASFPCRNAWKTISTIASWSGITPCTHALR